MKSFKNFMMEQEQLEEAYVKKGAVAAYALQGRKHGNNAVRGPTAEAKQALRAAVNMHKAPDQKSGCILTRALIALYSMGSLQHASRLVVCPAQVTSSTVI